MKPLSFPPAIFKQRYFFLCFFLALITGLKGQTYFNRALQFESEYPSRVLVIDKNLYFITATDAWLGGSESILNRYDSAGNIHERIFLRYMVTDALVTRNKTLVLLERQRVCDNPPMVYKHVLLELDRNLDTIRSKSFQKNVSGIVQLADDNYFMLGVDGEIEILDSNFVTLTDTSYTLGTVYALAEMVNGDVLVSHRESSQAKLSRFDKTGSLLITKPSPALFLGFRRSATQLWGSSGGKIYRLSANLDTVVYTGLSGITDFVIDKDTIFAVTNSPSDPPTYEVIKASTFQKIHSVAVSTASHVLNGISLFGNDVVVSSSGHSFFLNPYPNSNQYFAALNVMPKMGGDFFSADVELVKLIVESTDEHGNIRPALYIKNHGPLLTSLTLNCYGWPAITCGKNFRQFEFKNISISTGKAEWLVPDIYYAAMQGYSNEKICFNLTLPNSEVDKDPTNNTSCYFTTGVRENSFERVTVRLAPNPFSGILHVSCDVPIESVQVFSMQGKLLYEAQEDRNTLDLSDLAPGIYLVKIVTDEGIAIRKVIKQN